MLYYQGITYSTADNTQNIDIASVPYHISGYTRDGVWLMAHSLDSYIQSSQPHAPNWTNWHQLEEPTFVTNSTFSGETVCMYLLVGVAIDLK